MTGFLSELFSLGRRRTLPPVIAPTEPETGATVAGGMAADTTAVTVTIAATAKLVSEPSEAPKLEEAADSLSIPTKDANADAIVDAGIVAVYANASPEEIKLLENKKLGPDYTYSKRRFLAKVVGCYDGDTIRATFAPAEIFPATIQYKIRMLGYDSCEMRPLRITEDRELEKKMAMNARDALAAKIGGKLVILECGDFDKNGRILATVYSCEGENINSWMIASGHGWPYGGKTKTTAREAAKLFPSFAAQREIARRELAQPRSAAAPKPRRTIVRKEASRRNVVAHSGSDARAQ